MANNNDIAIKVENVSKTFKLPHEKRSSVKGLFVNMFRGKRTYETQKVLNDISFDIKKGEFFGIVGRNGSGKSTLLKLISGIYTPDKGSVSINGKLTPFIELGVGFSPDLTGRENVFLNGALLGFGRKEMEQMYDEIVEFAELEKFMDQKLKNYSSGMQVRLAFSIAIKAETPILVLDEILAVGDAEFQKKCVNFFAETKRKGNTVILVTHDMSAVQRFCTRALLINEGQIVSVGKPENITERYEHNTSTEQQSHEVLKFNEDNKWVTAQGKVTQKTPGEDIVLEFSIKAREDISSCLVGLTLQRSDGEYVFHYTTEKNYPNIEIKKNKKIAVKVKVQNIFREDVYRLNLSVKTMDRALEYFTGEGLLNFSISNIGRHGAILRPNFTEEVKL